MAALFSRHYGSAPVPEAAGVPDSLLKEHWMGIYRGAEKIGYSMTNIQKHKQGYRAFETVFMKIKAMGVEKDIEMATDAFTDNAFRIKSFTFSMKSDINMEVKGVVEGKELFITLKTGGTKSERRIPLKEKPYASLSLLPMLKKGIKAGEKIRLPVIEPSTLTQDTMELEVLKKETIPVMGVRQDAFRIKGSFKGADLYMWVTEEGEVLKQEAMGLTFIKEKKDNAMEIGKASVDLIAGMAIPFKLSGESRGFPPPEVDYLKVRLMGIDFEGFELDGGNQRLTGDILEVSRTGGNGPRRTESQPVLTGQKLEEYLEDTLFVQSKDPLIMSLAGEIAGGEKNILKKAKLIYEWVYDNIEKVTAVTVPSATEVLKSRRGDCNEHTTLFTALARASGIPTRMAAGLAYKDGYFYYHAWPEVYIDGWLAVDPTLGQWPADAAHIRLVTGGLEKQVRLASVMGKLRIEGLEFK